MSASTGRPGSGEESTATVGLAYTLPGGEQLSTLNYTLTNGANVYRGRIDISEASTISFNVQPAASGGGYIAIYSAVSDDGTVTCSGQQSGITVVNHVATLLDVQLTCLRNVNRDAGLEAGSGADAGYVDAPPIDAGEDVPSGDDAGGANDAAEVGSSVGSSDDASSEPPEGGTEAAAVDVHVAAAGDGATEDAPLEASPESLELDAAAEDSAPAFDDAGADANAELELDAAEDASEDAPTDASPDGPLVHCRRRDGWQPKPGCSANISAASTPRSSPLVLIFVGAVIARLRRRSPSGSDGVSRALAVGAALSLFALLCGCGASASTRAAAHDDGGASLEDASGTLTVNAFASCCATWDTMVADPNPVALGSSAALTANASGPCSKPDGGQLIECTWSVLAGTATITNQYSDGSGNFYGQLNCPPNDEVETLQLYCTDGPLPQGGVCPWWSTTGQLVVSCGNPVPEDGGMGEGGPELDAPGEEPIDAEPDATDPLRCKRHHGVKASGCAMNVSASAAESWAPLTLLLAGAVGWRLRRRSRSKTDVASRPGSLRKEEDR